MTDEQFDKAYEGALKRIRVLKQEENLKNASKLE